MRTGHSHKINIYTKLVGTVYFLKSCIKLLSYLLIIDKYQYLSQHNYGVMLPVNYTDILQLLTCQIGKH